MSLITPKIPKLFAVERQSWRNLFAQIEFVERSQSMLFDLNICNSYCVFVKSTSQVPGFTNEGRNGDLGLPLHYFGSDLCSMDAQPFIAYVSGTEQLASYCRTWLLTGNENLAELAQLLSKLAGFMINIIQAAERQTSNQQKINLRAVLAADTAGFGYVKTTFKSLNALNKQLNLELPKLVNGLGHLNEFITKRLAAISHDIYLDGYNELSFKEFDNTLLDIHFAISSMTLDIKQLIMSFNSLVKITELDQLSLSRYKKHWGQVLDAAMSFQPYVGAQDAFVKYSIN